METELPPYLNKSHNFGVHLKKGKRGIVQFDFPNKLIQLIQKGRIKKTYNFHTLNYFDSEDDLHIVCRFTENELEFDADTMEEKYTICRLLGIILETTDAESSAETPTTIGGLDVLPRIPYGVIKDAVLEKKGNTTITTWNKRRVRICIGEFSYFKPGEQLALNVVQMTPERCKLQRVGQNTINLTVNQRLYSFRVPSDSKSGLSTEATREDWYRAFEQAISYKRISSFAFPGFSVLETSISAESVSDLTSLDSLQSDSSTSQQSPNEDTQSISEVRSPEITPNDSISFSYNQQSLEHTQSNTGCSPTELGSIQIRTKKATVSPFKWRNKSSSFSFVEDGEEVDRSLEENNNEISSVGGLKGTFTSNSQLTTSHSVTNNTCLSSLEIEKKPSPDYSEVKDSHNNIEVNGQPVSPPPANIPSDPARADNKTSATKRLLNPPPLPPTAPLPPPMFADKPPPSPASLKLKQVHWTPVEKNRVAASLWSETKAQVINLDLNVLESMFSVIDKEVTLSNKCWTAPAQISLVDSKRAQNLGILFSGFKEDSLQQVLQALNSVSEPENFPIQKLTTLKRCQPSEEDMEVFRMYKKSRDTLTPVDRFMLDLCEIPKLNMRIDLALTLWDFPSRYETLIEDVEEVSGACNAILANTSLPVILRCLLRLGNHLNCSRQPKNVVQGFQISSIDKLVDLKGRNPQYTLITYLAEQIKAQDPTLLDWTTSLTMVPKVASCSILALGAEIDVMKTDIKKVKKYNKALRNLPGTQSVLHKKFQSDIQNFILESERKLESVHGKSEKLQQRFKQLLAWLGEPSTRTSDALFSSLALLIERFQQVRNRLGT